jgi:hypothetical protein
MRPYDDSWRIAQGASFSGFRLGRKIVVDEHDRLVGRRCLRLDILGQAFDGRTGTKRGLDEWPPVQMPVDGNAKVDDVCPAVVQVEQTRELLGSTSIVSFRFNRRFRECS